MSKNFSVLFSVDTDSHDDSSAVQRLRVLKEGLDQLGIRTGMIFLGDFKLSRPRVLLPANLPLFLKTVSQYDFVHAAGISSMAMGLAKSCADFKLICDIHGSTEEARMLKKSAFEGNYHWIVALTARKIALRTGNFFVTVSEPLRQQMINDGIEEKRTEILYNGVDTELFKPSPNRDSPFTVTYAGAYQKWQGVNNLVRAAELIKDSTIRFKFLGFKKSNTAVKREINERLKGKAELFDFQPRVSDKQPSTFINELAQSDVLVIPRYWDPAYPLYCNPTYVKKTFGWLSTKFAEYIATGRPVIVTDLDVAADFVQQYDCGFVSGANPEALAKTIMLAKETSRQELDRKGMNGRRLAEAEFDFKVITKKYLNLLSHIYKRSFDSL